MSNARRVAYVGQLMSPDYDRVIATRPDVRLDRLEYDHPEDAAAAILAQAHVYQISSTRDEIAPRWHGTAARIAGMPNLLAVSSNGAGFDTIDVAACTAAGVLVVNQVGGNAEAVAEHVLGFMLVLSKRIAETDHIMRRRSGIRRADHKGDDLVGRTVGIIGFGHVGRRIAALCRGLFAMRVLACDPYLDAATIAAAGGEKCGLPELLAGADFVSVNCPLTAETRGMIGAAQYALMRKHAFFITAARGLIHDEAALADALRAGRIAGAGLDVWAQEPPPHDHPLLAFDNVVVSPHTAGVTTQARDTMARIAAEQVLAILSGARPERLVNPPAWDAYCDRFRRVMGRAPDRPA